MSEMTVAGRKIGVHQTPFVIAEMSGNHNQSLDRALEIVDAAARSGAHGLKIQTYTPDTMTLNLSVGDFRIENPKSLWNGRSLYDLYGEAQTPWEWHEPIFERARTLGLIPFSTPFDESSVSFLEELDAPCYKIASFEIVDLPLIRRVAQTGKPMIISTGMATISEIADAVQCARNSGCESIALLKCTSTYPASPENTNLRTIPHMRDLFNCEVGISDHTMGVGASVGAVVLGASIVEKHFTLSRAEGGVDSAFSLEPSEMAQLVLETERAWRARGSISYGPTVAEGESLIFRRSLYFVDDVEEGQPLTKSNVRAIRPGKGLPPKYLDIVLGRRARCRIDRGTPVDWSLLQ